MSLDDSNWSIDTLLPGLVAFVMSDFCPFILHGTFVAFSNIHA
jgi:hypothetical protein